MWSAEMSEVSSEGLGVAGAHAFVPAQALEVCVPLLPELGASLSWRELCDAWRAQYSVLPHAVRLVRVSSGEVALVELRTDAEGYGELRVAGVVGTSDALRAGRALVGRHGVLVADGRVPGVVNERDGVFMMVSDELLDEALVSRGYRMAGASIDRRRTQLAEEVTSRLPLRRRSGLTTLREELMGLFQLRVCSPKR